MHFPLADLEVLSADYLAIGHNTPLVSTLCVVWLLCVYLPITCRFDDLAADGNSKSADGKCNLVSVYGTFSISRFGGAVSR